MAIALAINIILNLFLIPAYTYIGATVAAVITAVVLLALGLPKVYQEIHFDSKSLVRRSLLILADAGVMGGVIWYVQGFAPETPLGFGLIAASAVTSYAAMLLLTRALRWQDIVVMIQTVRNKVT